MNEQLDAMNCPHNGLASAQRYHALLHRATGLRIPTGFSCTATKVVGNLLGELPNYSKSQSVRPIFPMAAFPG
jgi:hypothetical protein